MLRLVLTAGDVINITYKQIVISTDECAKADRQAYCYLQNKSLDQKEIGDWEKVN